jgi:microcystin-dependent protein
MTTIESSKVNANFAILGASGIIQMFGGDVAPTGWLLCNGALVSRSTYNDLYATIGVKFGAGDGSTTFALPDFRGRVGVGKDGTTEFLNVGTIGGEKLHTLSIAELPSHYHTVDPPSTASGGVTANHTHNEHPSVYANVAGSDYWPHSGSSYWMNTEYSGRGAIATGTISSDHAHYTDIGQFNSGSTGTGTAFNVLQPYLTINYIIKI